jgi:hypothetical protein
VDVVVAGLGGMSQGIGASPARSLLTSQDGYVTMQVGQVGGGGARWSG